MGNKSSSKANRGGGFQRLSVNDGCSLLMPHDYDAKQLTTLYDTVMLYISPSIAAIPSLVHIIVSEYQPMPPVSQHMISFLLELPPCARSIGYLSSSLPPRPFDKEMMTRSTGTVAGVAGNGDINNDIGDHDMWRRIYGTCPIVTLSYAIYMQYNQRVYMIGQPAVAAASTSIPATANDVNPMMLISCPLSAIIASATLSSIPTNNEQLSSLLPWTIHCSSSTTPIPSAILPGVNRSTICVWNRTMIYIGTHDNNKNASSWCYNTHNNRFYTMTHPMSLHTRMEYIPNNLFPYHVINYNDDQLLAYNNDSFHHGIHIAVYQLDTIDDEKGAFIGRWIPVIDCDRMHGRTQLIGIQPLQLPIPPPINVATTKTKSKKSSSQVPTGSGPSKQTTSKGLMLVGSTVDQYPQHGHSTCIYTPPSLPSSSLHQLHGPGDGGGSDMSSCITPIADTILKWQSYEHMPYGLSTERRVYTIMNGTWLLLPAQISIGCYSTSIGVVPLASILTTHAAPNRQPNAKETRTDDDSLRHQWRIYPPQPYGSGQLFVITGQDFAICHEFC
jgi:hypothetical protein